MPRRVGYGGWGASTPARAIPHRNAPAKAHEPAASTHQGHAAASVGSPKRPWSVVTRAVPASKTTKAQHHHHSSSIRWATNTMSKARVNRATPVSRWIAVSSAGGCPRRSSRSHLGATARANPTTAETSASRLRTRRRVATAGGYHTARDRGPPRRHHRAGLRHAGAAV